MQGFLLGLANGATCLAYCAPALVPYLLGEGKNIRQNTFILCQFLTGRLLGYLIFAVVAGLAGHYIRLSPMNQELLLGAAYTILSVVMFVYSRTTSPATSCAAHSLGGLKSQITANYPAIMPLLIGFLTGLNLCPPFLLVFAESIGTQTIFQSLLTFFTFFLGTTLYFLPTPFLGIFKSFVPLKSIGKMAAILMSAYYLYTGIVMLIGGIKTI